MFFKKTKNLLFDIIFPPTCLNCKNYLTEIEKLNFICQKCFIAIPLNNSSFCPICFKRLPSNSKICNHPFKQHSQYPYILAPACSYQDQTIQNLIHFYKYESYQNIAVILSKILDIYLKKSQLLELFNSQNLIIIPIPLHPKKENKRGFNQSALLAKNLAQTYDLNFLPILLKTKNSPAQAKHKDFNQRKENVSGTFSLKNPDLIKNKAIILIDDVYTSGSTISEAARLLKQNGAKKIIALVIAKA